MDVFQMLRTVALQQNLSGDFPSWLMAEVMAIAERPERYAGKTDLIQRLITQVREYDAYAGTGCFDTGVSATTIQTTLRQITS